MSVSDALPALTFRLPWRWRLATCPPLHATTIQLDHRVREQAFAEFQIRPQPPPRSGMQPPLSILMAANVALP